MKGIDFSILFIGCIVEVYLIYTFFECFFEKHTWMDNRIVGFLIHIIMVGCMLIVNIVGNGDVNLFAIPILIWLYVTIIFEENIGSRLICFIIAFLILWGCEWLYAIILGINNHAYKNMSEMPLEFLSLKFLTYIIFIIVEQIIGKRQRKMENTIFIKYLLVPISGFGMMSVVFYAGFNIMNDDKLKILMIICFVLMLIGNIVIFYAFSRYSEEMHNNVEQQVLITRQKADLNYYKQMIQVNDEHYELIHNINHYMKVIYQLANERDCDEVMKIAETLGHQMEISEKIIYSHHHILNGILSEKRSQALKEKVEFDVYVEPGIKLNMVSDADLIAMLGNILDNALRAAIECNGERSVKIRIFMQEIGGYLVIKVVNTFSGKLLKKDEEFVTTKKEKGIHGIGIKSVNKMAEKYGGCLSCEIKENKFETLLLLSTFESKENVKNIG